MSHVRLFSVDSASYALARPRYPAALYAWLASQCGDRRAAWDCATGNGQAAAGLADYFEIVQATDLSAEQIIQAVARPNVAYSVRSAEDSRFAASTFDLVTVAQALHWFDPARFWPEVSRVSRPGALFCAWGYDWPRCTSDVDRELVAPVCRILEPYWAAEHRILWEGYPSSAIKLPFPRMSTPEFTIEARWPVAALVRYMQTWSAFKNADTAASAALADVLERACERLGRQTDVPIRMPLVMVAARVEPG